jgi:uncharacterized LabA/DUF88 family protein
MVRRAVLIDGPNLYTTQKALGLEIDYKNLLSFLSHGVTMASAPYYFTAVRPEGEYASVRPLLDWLSYNGYHVVQKPVKEFTDSQGVRKIKGNMHVEIVVQAMTLAQSARVAIAVGSIVWRDRLAGAQEPQSLVAVWLYGRGVGAVHLDGQLVNGRPLVASDV